MIDFIERFGVTLIFAVVFADQVGLPVPATPLVLALGALAGRGSIEPISALLVGTVASLSASVVWFLLGRRMGARVLALACRISLEPDTCVSKTKDHFARKGVKSLVVAKFLPGIDILAPPLAGLAGVRFLPFLGWSAAGAFLWLLVIGGAGYLLGNRIDDLQGRVADLGSTLGVLVVGGLALYVGWKYVQRERVLRALRLARITPEELHRMILAGAQPVIVDVRSELSLELLPFTIPGALFLTPEELDRRHAELPRDRELILYCA